MAIPPSARIDPANSAQVPATIARSSWPPVSATSASTTARCEPIRCASPETVKPITAKHSVGSASSSPATVSPSPVDRCSSGITTPSALTAGRRLSARSTTAVIITRPPVSRARFAEAVSRVSNPTDPRLGSSMLTDAEYGPRTPRLRLPWATGERVRAEGGSDARRGSASWQAYRL